MFVCVFYLILYKSRITIIITNFKFNVKIKKKYLDKPIEVKKKANSFINKSFQFKILLQSCQFMFMYLCKYTIS